MLRAMKLAVLLGTLDPEHPLCILRGNADVWRDIFQRLDAWHAAWCDSHVDWDSVAYTVQPYTWSAHGEITFPEPRDLNINMMPIKLHDETSLPEECYQYAEMIHACTARMLKTDEDDEKIAYLTIHESRVPVGQAHRRPGLHVERPGALLEGGRLVGAGDAGYHELTWGCGHFDEFPINGIYMASSVDNSSRVWPVLIQDAHEVSDAHGGIEHMREHLGPGHHLSANQLCWITDRTPHESVPLQAPADDPDAQFVYRQFFRLVAGKISVWYSKHNTPNPTGVQPDAEISDVDKFATA